MTALRSNVLTIDLGRVSKRTRGTYTGFYMEAGWAPFIWYPVR
jgi:hypothetical protein